MSERDSPFVEGEGFDDWLAKNEELIHDMYHEDAYELLYEAWIAGYKHGLTNMIQFAKPLWPKNQS